MTSQPVRVGLIGCGRIMEQGHAPAFEALPDIYRIVAVADPSDDRRAALGDRFEVPATRRHADFRDLLAAGEVDMVDIAVPHAFHAEACLAAAAAGLPMSIEKPLATTLDDAVAMVDAVEAAGVAFTVMHNYLHHPAVAATVAAVKRGDVGSPFLYRSEWMGPAHYDGAAGYDPAWRTKRAVSGGGALIDNAYHYLYLSKAVLGSPITEVYARTGTFVHDQDVEDTAALLLTHASGAISTILAAWSARGAQRVHEVHGDAASIRIEVGTGNQQATLVTADGESPLPRPDPDGPDGFTAILQAFARTLHDGDPAPYPAREALAMLRIVLAAYESAASGRPVEVPTS